MSLSGANTQPKWGVEEWKFDLGRIHAYQRSKWDAFSKGYNWQTQLGQATGSVPNLLPSNGWIPILYCLLHQHRYIHKLKYSADWSMTSSSWTFCNDDAIDKYNFQDKWARFNYGCWAEHSTLLSQEHSCYFVYMEWLHVMRSQMWMLSNQIIVAESPVWQSLNHEYGYKRATSKSTQLSTKFWVKLLLLLENTIKLNFKALENLNPLQGPPHTSSINTQNRSKN